MPVPKRRHTDQQDRLIEDISKASSEFKPLKDRRQLRRFIGDYYRNLSVEDARGIEAGELAAAALAHLKAARRLADGEHSLKVFNPSVERNGWSSPHTVVQLVHRNMPFLVDSLSMTLDRLGYAIQLTIHPLIRCQRTDKGQLQKVLAGTASDGQVESYIRFDITRETRPERLAEIHEAIESTLTDVRAAVTDWPAMRQKMRDCIDALAHGSVKSAKLDESIELLRWLADDRFTFLGYREYRLHGEDDDMSLKPVRGSALGVKAVGGRHGRTHKLTRPMQRFRRSADVLLITKANSRSTVHRSSYLDYIGIKSYDADGKAIGELRFVGLLTSQAYSETPADIPLVRGKIQEIVDRSGLDATGHRGKALIHILNNYPRDELFQASVSDLLRTTTGILNLQDRRRVKLFLRRDTFRRFYSCLVFVPREKYNTEVREKTEKILTEALEASTVQSTVQVSDSALARVHLLVYASADKKPHISIRGIEAAIGDAVVTWRDRLRDELIGHFDQQRGDDLFEQFGRMFPLAYEEDNSPAQGCLDIQHVERKLGDNSDELDDFTLCIDEAEDGDPLIRFRVFRLDQPIALSNALPLLENLGMRVLSERPYHLRLTQRRAWIQDFELAPQATTDIKQLRRLTGQFAEGFAAQLHGTAESDGYNRLIIAAELDSRTVTLVRAYAKYLMQLGLPFSQSYMEDMLCQHDGIIRKLMDWYEARFADAGGDSAKRSEKLSTQLRRDIRDANSLDADRALRALYSAMHATVRSNFFWRDDDGKPAPCIAFKIETSKIDEAPLPRPKHEIFVYSPRVEGVHLRAGDVARGGLRWSDRREDFRTEVLGLMKAQTVKNTVIVPTGAKGGFYPKQLPDGDRDAVMAEVIACYKIFINALLSLTDNIVDGRIVPPDGIVCHETPDPYLVVAADKGTATFSDTANEIAVARNFWLGDAFASGGSAGYDHKKMAITARGAWEAVRRHFREIGVDTQSDNFTVAGIGDMSGDVFGNGMLLSKTIRLQAAFNHQHIFIDPDPDAETGFAERKRLFEMPRSSWTDYDADKISKGGGIFERKAKAIAISDEMKKLLGTEADELSAYELIRHILKMPVDLLWNGGIGTYVKSSGESNSDVGDRHNDNLRVDAAELRCKVIGEGGNLGLTQLARIEFAIKGGKLNTDFIDNSAGVDSSDREVNIKILLRLAATRSSLSKKARDRLLADMTDDVAKLVLRNNYLQTQAISMMESNAADRLSEHRGLIDLLERSGFLNRSLEYLPNDDALDERKRNQKGLTRPEISVILSYAKLDLYQRLSADRSALSQDQIGELQRYFPAKLQKKYPDLIPAHELGREIITTLLTNSIVNRMGPVFPTRAEQDTGYSIASVAQSYEIARDITGARDIWDDIEGLDTRIPTDIQYAMMFEVSRKLRHACYWLLRTHDGAFADGLAGSLFEPVQRVLAGLDDLMAASGRKRLRDLNRRHGRMGVPDKLASRVSALSFITDVLEIVRIAEQRNCGTDIIGKVYFSLGQRLQLDWVRQAIDNLRVEGRWQARARGTLRDNAVRAQRELTGRVHSLNQCVASEDSIDELLASDPDSFERVQQLITQMRENDGTDFATLTVAVDEFKQLTLKV